MKKISVPFISRCGMIAAIYFVISFVTLPLAYGAVQVRFSEALTLLPVLTPAGIWGVTVGCILTNAYGVSVGANILGAADILLGSLATLVAAILSRWLRRYQWKNLPVLSAVPPVLVNALVVGGELTIAETGRLTTKLFWLNFFQVGLGQMLACFVLGLSMIYALRRTGLSDKLF